MAAFSSCLILPVEKKNGSINSYWITYFLYVQYSSLVLKQHSLWNNENVLFSP